MNRSFDQDELKEFLKELFQPENMLGKLKQAVPEAEVRAFARKNDVLNATQEYLKKITELWDDYSGKSNTKRTLSSSPNSSIRIINDDQPSTKEVQSMSPDNSQTPGSVPKNAPPSITPNPKITFTLKNAKVGESYSEEIQVQGETDIKKVVIQDVVLPEGLTASPPEFRKITGIPLKDGDQEISINYRFQHSDANRPIILGKCNIFINPDPKSLWKKLDPPKDDPYFKVNEDKYIATGSDNLTLVAASRRGRSHEHSGTFRDDDFALTREGEWDILAVADGAGSAKSSRKGSEIAVKVSVEQVKNRLSAHGAEIEQEASAFHLNKDEHKDDQLLRNVLNKVFASSARSAVEKIENEAEQKAANVKDYSTTLILAAHKKMPFGHFFASYWVGDGGVGVYQKGNRVTLLGEVDSGEFAGQTRFINMGMVSKREELMKRIQFCIVDDFTSLVLMTDGVTDPKFETDNNLAKIQKWDELWKELEPLVQDKHAAPDALLSWLEFWSQGNHDDRTIALLCK